MKSVMISAMLIIFGNTLMIAFSWWVRYDHIQNTTRTNTKRAIAYSMVKVREQDVFDANDVIRYFQDYFIMNKVDGYQYKITLSGYVQDPLFVKMSVQAKNEEKLSSMNIEVEEAMLEEVADEE